MKSQINILRQLQELVLTRDEHHQTGDGSHLDALNDSIADLQQKLDPQVAGLYDRLYKKNHIVISAMTNNCCAVCGMQVPIAQGQQVRLAQHLVTCSSCGRILFANPEDAAQNIAEGGVVVLVLEGEKGGNITAGLAGVEVGGGTQVAKLMGNGRAAHVQPRSNVAHAQLPIAQFTDDARPCGIAADLEKLRYFRDRPGLVFVHGLHLPYIFM